MIKTISITRRNWTNTRLPPFPRMKYFDTLSSYIADSTWIWCIISWIQIKNNHFLHRKFQIAQQVKTESTLMDQGEKKLSPLEIRRRENWNQTHLD